MTATSQRVKILKPILGSPAVFLSHWAAEIRDPTDITEFSLFPSLPVLPLLLSSEGAVWPPNTPDTLCCYFRYKISIQGLLDAFQCLFSTPPTQFLLNARQFEHFLNWHFSRKHLSASCPVLNRVKVNTGCMHDSRWLVWDVFSEPQLLPQSIWRLVLNDKWGGRAAWLVMICT